MKNALTLLMITSLVLTASSCKKNNDLNTREMLIGTWTLSEIGSDNNNNNEIDTGETFPSVTSDTRDTMTLRNDNTYTDIYNSGGINGIHRNELGTWTYGNNRINLITPSKSDYMPVHSVTSNKLVVKVENLWSIYIK